MKGAFPLLLAAGMAADRGAPPPPAPPPPPASAAAADYPRLRGLAVASLDRARGKLPSLDGNARAISFPSVEMLIEEADRRAHDVTVPARDWDFVRQSLETARAYADQLAAGHDPYRGVTGLVMKAYRAPEDDTLQPYAVYIPRGAPPAAGWPLVVALHGAYTDHRLNMRRAFGLSNRPGETDTEASRNELPLPDRPVIVAAPFGRGEFGGFDGLGEADVLRVMADVQHAYAVDPDRVHLTGLSMGGEGTWHIGLHHPDLFASLTPVCGIVDAGHFVPGPNRALYDPALMALGSPLAIADNARNLQVTIYHGDVDPTVPVGDARAMAQRYRQLGWLGKNVRYFELPKVDHFAWEVSYRDAKLLQDLAAIKRDPFPRHVTYKTPSLRYNKAYWLRIDAIDRGLALAEIDGERGDGTFAVRATNVGAFSLLLDPKDVPPARSITVTVDGATVYKGAPRPVLGFARAGGAWKPVDGSATPPALPQHAASGLFSRALARERAHLYVYGTGGRPEVTAANRALARAMADWGPGVRVRFPAKADSEVSAAELASHDLVLIGSARTNTLVRRMQLGERTTQGHDRLPIDDGADRLVAGALSLADADRSYRLACPNPLAPGRNVLIYGADSPAALARFDRFAKGNAAAWGPESNLDYVIWDGAGKVRASGVFRDRWKIGE